MSALHMLYNNEKDARNGVDPNLRNVDFFQAIYCDKHFMGFARGFTINELIKAKKRLTKKSNYRSYGKIIKRSYGNNKRIE